MTISEVIFETISDIIDGCVHYYDQNELLEIADNYDILEIVACHLKVDSRLSFYKITAEEIARIEAFNWKEQAKKHIKQYLTEHYLSDRDESSEDEREDEKLNHMCVPSQL